MAPFSVLSVLIGLALSSTVAAEIPSTTPQIKTWHMGLKDLDSEFNTTAVTKTLSLSGVSPTKGHEDLTITTAVCLAPAVDAAPDSEECSAICQALAGSGDTIQVQPFEIYAAQSPNNLCVFEIANLEACVIYQTAVSDLAGICNSMLTQCVNYGADAFAEFTGPSIAVALSGVPAAPPYSAQPCT